MGLDRTMQWGREATNQSTTPNEKPQKSKGDNRGVNPKESSLDNNWKEDDQNESDQTTSENEKNCIPNDNEEKKENPNKKKEKVSHIKFAFWNVEGLYEKLNLDGLCEFIQSHDVIGLGETFTLPNFDFSVKFPEHFALHCPATKFSKLGRPSGGIVLLIRKTLEEYIDIVETNLSHVLAIKISKKILLTSRDLLVISMYNHPKESIFYKNKDYHSTLEQTEQFIANQIEQGKDFDILLKGDLNARIGDWAHEEDEENYNHEGENKYYERESQDTVINGLGKVLIEICTTFSMTPLNGLKEKNFKSQMTFIGHRGSSIIDHFVATTELVDYVYEHETTNRIESNHLPIQLKLKCKEKTLIDDANTEEEKFSRTKWQESKATESQNILNKERMNKLIQEAEDDIHIDIDNSVESFNHAMGWANNPMKQVITPNKKKKEKKAWFNKECLESKKKTRKLLKKLNRINKVKNERKYERVKKEYLETKLTYNKLIKEKKKIYKKEMQDKLIENRKDSKKFWDLIKKINFKSMKLPRIDVKEWGLYFKNLLHPGEKVTTTEKKDQTENQRNIEIEELDKEITEMEIKQAIDKQKKQKSAGVDEISAELLKLAKPKIVGYLTKLFNEIYNKSHFPKQWATSIIVPLHKKGSKLLMDNYRG